MTQVTVRDKFIFTFCTDWLLRNSLFYILQINSKIMPAWVKQRFFCFFTSGWCTSSQTIISHIGKDTRVPICWFLIAVVMCGFTISIWSWTWSVGRQVIIIGKVKMADGMELLNWSSSFGISEHQSNVEFFWRIQGHRWIELGGWMSTCLV